MLNYSVGTEVYLALYSQSSGKGADRVSPATITRLKKEADKVVGIFVRETDHELESYLPLSRFGELIFHSYHEAEKAISERPERRQSSSTVA